MKPKILVGCPASKYQEYCLEEYVKSIKNLTYSNYDILLVDNSKDNKYMNKIKKMGIPVIKGLWFEGARDRIVASRNILRQTVLDKNYDYFLSLEQDVIPPKDVIERLLSHKKDVVSGLYYTVKDKALRPLILINDHKTSKLYYLDSERVLKFKNLIRVKMCGLGCVLISRSVLEKVKFRYVVGNKSFDDFWFCRDAISNGFDINADMNVKCKHLFLNRPWKWKELQK